MEAFRNIKGPMRHKLIAARKAKGFTQPELAELAGCSLTMISLLETGRAKAGFELSMKLENILEVAHIKLFEEF